MPGIREQALNGDGFIVRITDADGHGIALLNNAYQVWLANNPDATASDFENALETLLSTVNGRDDVQVNVHVHSLPEWPDVPHVALLMAREGVTIPADWWEHDE